MNKKIYDGYKKIEEGVVEVYKKIEDGVDSGMECVQRRCDHGKYWDYCVTSYGSGMEKDGKESADQSIWKNNCCFSDWNCSTALPDSIYQRIEIEKKVEAVAWKGGSFLSWG